jgi:hypothetical protein
MFKYCHGCGGEFQQWVQTCPDCHEPLHAEPAEPARAHGREASSPPAAPLEDPLLLRLGEPWELRALAQSLQQRGISSQIDTHPLGAEIAAGSRAGSRGQPARLGIYVARSDLDAVREFAAEFATSEMPDRDAGLVRDPGACPACGEPTPENAASCSACGLEFPEAEPDPGGR